ncbi:MAG: CBS domain-containing protein [Paracoccaceae bacterium]|jgi:CBS domain-containing protein
MTVEKILNQKGTHASVVAPDAKVADVIATLESEDVGALVVSANGLTIDGIISERDIVRGLLQHGPSVLDHTVSDLMTKDVITCTADDRVAGVMAIMDQHNIRHVPVTDEGVLAGIVSIRDINKLRLNEVQAEANAMRDYISTGH